MGVDPSEHVPLDIQIFEYRFDDQIGARQLRPIRGRMQTHLVVCCRAGLELARSHPCPIVIRYPLTTAHQRCLVLLQQHHRQTHLQGRHGDARAHGARSNDGHRLHRAWGSLNIRWQSHSLPFRKELVPQRVRFGGNTKLLEHGALAGQTFDEGQPCCILYGLHRRHNGRAMLARAQCGLHRRVDRGGFFGRHNLLADAALALESVRQRNGTALQLVSDQLVDQAQIACRPRP